MLKKIDIIYFTLFRWDNKYSSVSLSITKELMKNHRIFYINHPYSLKDVWTERNDPLLRERLASMLTGKVRYEKIPNTNENVIGIQPPITLPINWLPEGKIYDTLQAANNRAIYYAVQDVIKKYDIKEFIYMNCFNPFFAGTLPERFNPKLNIYQCIDDLKTDVYTARHAVRLDEEAIKIADVPTVTSRELFRLKKHLNPNLQIVHNAADTELFKSVRTAIYERPKELEGVTTKVIGFTGNLDQGRINYSLIKNIALAHPDKTVLLVGPLNNTTYKEIELDKVPNIIFAGSKNIKELPQYLQYMDVAIIPFSINTQTLSIYPLKINEYLAAGVPIIASNFSEDIRTFSHVAYIAKDENHFLELIDIAIAENSEERKIARVEEADRNTWTARMDQLWADLEQYIEKTQSNKSVLNSKS
jgi:teichuronic acid biosynthesis glycosyltransferase TuaH